jgi:hypothetical protein
MGKYRNFILLFVSFLNYFFSFLIIFFKIPVIMFVSIALRGLVSCLISLFDNEV